MLKRVRRLLLLAGVPLVAVVGVLSTRPWEAGWTAVWFVAAGALIEAKPVRLKDHVRGSMASVATGLAILIGGAPAAVAAGLGAAITIVAQLPASMRLVKGSYNLGMFVLSPLLAAKSFEMITGMQSASLDHVVVGPWLIAIVVAQFVHHLTNVTLLASAIAVTGGRGVRSILTPVLEAAWWAQAFAPAIAIAAYVLFVEAGPLGLVLLVVPIASAHRSMAGVEGQRASLDQAVRALVRLVEVKDRYTRGHAERVADLSDRVALQLGLSEEERYWIRIGAVLHDVGKVGIPIEVLNKPGGFTADEQHQMRRHPDVGADLLADVEALAPVVPLVRRHHERLDGCGYPRGLDADDLPLSVRIISAVDSWDAMTTTRPYRTALPVAVAVAELRAHAGTQFDGHVVETLIEIVAPEFIPPAEPVPAGRHELVTGPMAEVVT